MKEARRQGTRCRRAVDTNSVTVNSIYNGVLDKHKRLRYAQAVCA